MLSIHEKTGLPDNPCVDTIQRDGLVCPLPQHNICVFGNTISLYIGLGSVYVGVRGKIILFTLLILSGFCVCGGSGLYLNERDGRVFWVLCMWGFGPSVD